MHWISIPTQSAHLSILCLLQCAFALYSVLYAEEYVFIGEHTCHVHIHRTQHTTHIAFLTPSLDSMNRCILFSNSFVLSIFTIRWFCLDRMILHVGCTRLYRIRKPMMKIMIIKCEIHVFMVLGVLCEVRVRILTRSTDNPLVSASQVNIRLPSYWLSWSPNLGTEDIFVVCIIQLHKFLPLLSFICTILLVNRKEKKKSYSIELWRHKIPFGFQFIIRSCPYLIHPAERKKE